MELQGCTRPLDSCLPRHHLEGQVGLGLSLLRVCPRHHTNVSLSPWPHDLSPSPQRQGGCWWRREYFPDAESVEQNTTV